MGTKDAASIPVNVKGSPANVAEDARHEDHDGLRIELLWTRPARTPDLLLIQPIFPSMRVWKYGSGLHGTAESIQFNDDPTRRI